ncbi:MULTISPECIES: hypothetical protein [unclassified Acinetobacter]|uniref:hypothetical protein n=1 Tax=unclassified Acinetobacter TaxID=196816 RepID=UPI0035BA89E8
MDMLKLVTTCTVMLLALGLTACQTTKALSTAVTGDNVSDKFKCSQSNPGNYQHYGDCQFQRIKQMEAQQNATS